MNLEKKKNKRDSKLCQYKNVSELLNLYKHKNLYVDAAN